MKRLLKFQLMNYRGLDMKVFLGISLSVTLLGWLSHQLFNVTAGTILTANILAFSLYFCSFSLIILMLGLSFLAAAGERFGAALWGFSVVLLVIYLLIFQADLNLMGLVTAPIAGLTEGAAVAAGSLLQTPWNAAWRNIFITTAALILQYMSLTYLLNGRVDTA